MQNSNPLPPQLATNPKQSIPERRREPRAPSSGMAFVRMGSHWRLLKGKVINASTTGVLMEFDHAAGLTIENTASVIWRVPSSLRKTSNAPRFGFQGSVVRVKSTSGRKLYCAMKCRLDS